MNEQLVTLCFIVCDGQVLLMRKKRGIGAGKINAPGGKVEPGETPLAAAIRETEEEVGVIPQAPELCGDLIFRFTGGPTLRCLVYRTEGYTGELRETDEAAPLWYSSDALPYDEMWADDRTWVPMLLRGECFTGEVEVLGEQVIAQRIRVLSNDYHISKLRMQN